MSSYPVKFGSFNAVCQRAALIPCPLLGTSQGIEPDCYSRNVQLGAQLIFQPATCFVHIAALIMTAIMIFHIRSKYTAVGRKEIVMFFYIYMVIELLAIFLDSAIIPTANGSYPWFAAVYAGLIGAIYWCLVVNGFVGFQFAEDGTPMSLWFLRISSLAVFGVCFFIAIATFKEFAGFRYTNTTGLFITYLLFPAICAIVYVVSQLILVVRTLDDRWAIGDILFGIAFYAIGVVLLLAFSVKICNAVSHYIDGVFFFTLCMLLSVMMVYKYWDSITKEDLEFSVGSKASVWEVKDPLLPPNPDFAEEETSSVYHAAGGSLVGGMTGNQYYGNVNYSRDRPAYAASSASGHMSSAGRYAAQAGNTGGYGS